MTEIPKVNSTDGITDELQVCPHCHKKLLTRSSILCNWCGEKIDHPEYQQRAAQTRQEADEIIRKRLAESQIEENRLGIIGRLFGRVKNAKDKRTSPPESE